MAATFLALGTLVGALPAGPKMLKTHQVMSAAFPTLKVTLTTKILLGFIAIGVQEVITITPPG